MIGAWVAALAGTLVGALLLLAVSLLVGQPHLQVVYLGA